MVNERTNYITNIQMKPQHYFVDRDELTNLQTNPLNPFAYLGLDVFLSTIVFNEQ